MIRTTCAWILLLIATSPVTAERAVISSSARFDWAVSAICVPAAIDGDAFSVSPHVTRSILPESTAPNAALRPVRAFVQAGGAQSHRLRDFNRSRHQRFMAATVLRL